MTSISDLFLGVDVGGTTVTMAITSPDGAILARRDHPTRLAADDLPASLSRWLTELCRDTDIGRHRIRGAGLGLPGVLSPDGRLERCPALPRLNGSDVHRTFHQELGMAVALENDATLAALGEYHHGNHGVSDLVCVSLGTGIGVGVVNEGRMLRGFHGAAGEVSDLIVFDGLDAIRAETVASAAGLASMTGRIPAELPGAVAQAADGDAQATAGVERYCKVVAEVIALTNLIVDTGVVILAGGIGANGWIRQRIEHYLGLRTEPAPPLRSSTLNGLAATLGAVDLARHLASKTAPMSSTL